MSGYVVKKGDTYVQRAQLTAVGVPVVSYCDQEGEAHQFEKDGAAEAIAFLVGGYAYWHEDRT
jgi:hypothetical protein